MKQTNLRDSSLADSLEIVLEPRVMFDGAAVATAAQAADQVNHQAADSDGNNHEVAPQADGDIGVTAQPNGGKVTVNADGHAQDGADLFKDVSVQGDTIDHLTFEVDAAGSGHALVIGGVQVDMKDGASAVMSGDFDGLNIEVKGNGPDKYTVTVYVTGVDPAKVGDLIDHMTYKTTDGTQVTNGQTVTVKLTAVSDGTNDTDEDISSTVTIESTYNQPPTVDTEGELNLSDQSAAAGDYVGTSQDGSISYVLTKDGKLTAFAIQDGKLTQIGDPLQLDLSADGSTIQDFLVTKDGSKAYVSLYNGRIIELVYKDNAVTVSDRMLQITSVDWEGNINNDNAGDLALSDDGKWLFIANGMEQYGGNGRLFTIDLETGKQTWQGNAVGNGHAYIEYSNGFVVITTNTGFMGLNVNIYSVGDDGSLNQTGTTSHIDIDGGTAASPYVSVISPDGKKLAIYLKTEDFDENWNSVYTGKVAIYNIGTDGSLSGGKVSVITEKATSLVFSADGSSLNALTDDNGQGGVLSYVVQDDTGIGTETQIISDIGASSGLAMSASGQVIITGQGTYLYSELLNGSFGQNLAFGEKLTLSDPELDRADNWGKASITVISSYTNGTYAFSRDGYSAVGSEIRGEYGVLATFSVQNGKLVLTFADGTTAQQAKDIVKGFSYLVATGEAGKLSFTVSVSDGEKVSKQADLVYALAPNTPPTVTHDGNLEQAINTAGKEVTVFPDVVFNTGEAGQKITSVTIDINSSTTINSSTEYIVIDGQKIFLDQQSHQPVTGNSGLVVTYGPNADGTKAVVTLIAKDGILPKDLQRVVSGLSYGNGSEAGSAAVGLNGDRTFTITAIQDNGGTYNGGEDTTNPDLAATIHVEMNSAPDLSFNGDGSSSGIYAIDGKLEGFSGFPKDIEFSADGKYVFVAAVDGSNINNGDTKLYVFSRDTASGKLTLLSTVDSSKGGEAAEYLKHISTVSLAPDGKTLFLGAGNGSGYGLLSLTIAENGELSDPHVVAVQDAQANTGLDYYPSDFSYYQHGEKTYLYVVDGKSWTGGIWPSKDGGTSISVFEVGTDGSLTLVQTVADVKANDVAIHGSTLIVGNNTSGTLLCYRIADDGSITNPIEVPLQDGASAQGNTNLSYNIEIAPDGKHVYVMADMNKGTNSILIYFLDSETNKLTFQKAINLETDGLQDNSWPSKGPYLSMSADGKSVAVGTFGSTNVLLYSVGTDGDLTKTGTLTYTNGGNVFGNTIAFSPDGKNIYYGGYIQGGGLVTSSSLPSISYVDGGSAVVGSGLNLSDLDNDNGGNYKDTSLTFSRDNGSANDQWSLLKGKDFQLSKDGHSIVDQSGNSIATWTVNDDGSLTLQFTAEVDKDTANAVIKRVSFTSTENLTGSTLFHVTVNDHGEDGKADEVSFAVSQGNMSLVNPDKDTTLFYDQAGVQLFPEAVINAPDSGVGGATLTVTADDPVASFDVGAQSGFTFDKDTHEVKSGDTVIGTYTEQNGELTITFKDTAALTDINGVLQHLVYKGQISAGQDANFGIEYKDASGATATLADAVTVHANAAPEFNDQYKDQPFLIYPGAQNLNYQLPEDLFSDKEDASADLQWKVDSSTLPDGLTFDTTTHTLKGNVPADAKSYTVTVTVTDKQGATVTQTITFEASDQANQPPAVVAGAELAQQPTAGGEYSSSVSGFFKDPNAGDKVVKYALADEANFPLPDGLELNETTGEISGTTNVAGKFTIKVVATDSMGAESQPAIIHLSVANEAPEAVAGTENPHVTAGKEQTIDVTGMFSDKDVGQNNNQHLTFDFADEPSVPDWLSLKDGVITVTKEPPSLDPVTIKIICKDGVTNVDGTPVQAEAEITIHFDNQAPQATEGTEDLPLIVKGDSSKIDLSKYFSDPDTAKGQNLTYTVEGSLPDGLTITDGKIQGSTANADPKTYRFTVVASDGYATATKEFTVDVRGNSLPAMVPAWVDGAAEIQPGHFNVTVGAPVQVDLSNVIVDPDGDTVTIKSVEGLPEGLTYKDGVISGTVSTFVDTTVVITASDGHGTDVEFKLTFHSDNAPFTVPVTQFQHAPLYDPTADHELEEDLLIPVAPTSDLPDASIDLAGSSAPFATSQGLSMAMAALQASEPGSKGLSGAALLSAAQVAHSVQHGDVAQPLHGMDQTGKAAAVRAGSSMTLPTQGDKGTPVDEFLWQGSNVILNGTPTADGDPVVPSKVVPAQVSMAGKPAFTQQVHESSAYGDEQPSAKA